MKIEDLAIEINRLDADIDAHNKVRDLHAEKAKELAKHRAQLFATLQTLKTVPEGKHAAVIAALGIASAERVNG